MDSFDRNTSSKNLLRDLQVLKDNKKGFYRKDPYSKDFPNVAGPGTTVNHSKYSYLKEVIEST